MRKKFTKKFGKIGISAIVVMLAAGIAIPVFAGSQYSELFKNWGQKLKEYADKENTETEQLQPQNMIILSEEDIQLATSFYELQGYDEASARTEAETYLLEREALYQEAIKNGYTVTDEEVWTYLDELKKIIDSAENKEDAYAIMSAFDSEDEYWAYEFKVYQKNLPIQNYVKALETQFYEEYSNSEKAKGIEQTWEEYFENYKQELVQQKQYEVKE